MGALAAAKARIGEIVAQEYARTRHQRRRKTAARFLGRERAEEGPPSVPAPTIGEIGELEVPASPSLAEAAAAWDIAADLAAPGWGVDYDPPRAEGRASRR